MPWFCPPVIYALMEGTWIKQNKQWEAMPMLSNITNKSTSFECKVWTPENWKITRWRNDINKMINLSSGLQTFSTHNTTDWSQIFFSVLVRHYSQQNLRSIKCIYYKLPAGLRTETSRSCSLNKRKVINLKAQIFCGRWKKEILS